MRRVATAFISLALLCSAQAFAQQLGPNGGLLGAPSGGHQAELVLSPTEVTVYILEKGKVHDTAGAKMRIVIQQLGKTTTVDLADQQGKRLTGKLEVFRAPTHARISLFRAFPRPTQGRPLSGTLRRSALISTLVRSDPKGVVCDTDQDEWA